MSFTGGYNSSEAGRYFKAVHVFVKLRSHLKLMKLVLEKCPFLCVLYLLCLLLHSCRLPLPSQITSPSKYCSCLCHSWLMITFMHQSFIGLLKRTNHHNHYVCVCPVPGPSDRGNVSSDVGSTDQDKVIRIKHDVVKESKCSLYSRFKICHRLLFRIQTPIRNLGTPAHVIAGLPTMSCFTSIKWE